MSDLRGWEMWLRGQPVGVLPYDPVSNNFVMIEQVRFPAMPAGFDPLMLEVPGGFMDANETEEQTAVREMQEGMRLAADRFHRVGQFVLSARGSDESVTILAGRVAAPPVGSDGIVGYAGLTSENEDIRIRVLPALPTIDHALAGRCSNAATVIALFWFANRRDWVREQWAA